MIPKSGHLISPEYLRFVRQLPCAFCHSDPPVHAHHHPPKGRGVLRDDNSLPSCAVCHSRCHGIPVAVNGVVRGAIPEVEQEIAVARTRVAFLDHAPAADLAAYQEQLMAWRAKRGEAVAW